MYRKNKNNWVKHLDFMILDLICLQVAFFLAYTLRHRTVNLYTNYIYANLSIVLILIDVNYCARSRMYLQIIYVAPIMPNC